jgi:hypothetical protein
LPTLPKPSLASPLPVLDVCAMAHGPCLARPKALLAHLLHCCPCLLFLAHVPWRCYVRLAPQPGDNASAGGLKSLSSLSSM